MTLDRGTSLDPRWDNRNRREMWSSQAATARAAAEKAASERAAGEKAVAEADATARREAKDKAEAERRSAKERAEAERRAESDRRAREQAEVERRARLPENVAVQIWSAARDGLARGQSFVPGLREEATKRGWQTRETDPPVYALVTPDGLHLYVPHPERGLDNQVLKKWFAIDGAGSKWRMTDAARLANDIDPQSLGGIIPLDLVNQGRIVAS